MNNRSALPFALLALFISSVGAGAAACSGGDEPRTTGDTSSVGGSGGGGAGGAGPGGGPSNPPNALPPDGTPEATSQGPQVACDKLDPQKPAIVSFGAEDSNAMGGPPHIREILELGLGIEPWTGEARRYEMLNYYRIDYPAPAVGQISLFPELAATKTPDELDFQLGVRSFDAQMPRRPMTLTFVVDTSDSMLGPGMTRARAAVQAVAKSLSAGDVVNVVTWNKESAAVLSGHAVSGPNDATLLGVADKLEPNGSTDLHNALVSGYALAEQHYGPDRLNRVILISDGGAGISEPDAALIAEKSVDESKEGIYLVAVGTGPALSFNERPLRIAADRGRGAYVYLDKPEEAARMFVERFDETMEIAARDVMVELTLPWYFQARGGEAFNEEAKDDPQHLAPSDAMIFSRVLEACDASTINPDDDITVRVKWKIPLTLVEQQAELTMTVQSLLDATKDGLPKGKAILAYAEALRMPSQKALAAARALALEANPAGTDADLAEIISLIEKHPQY
ncbi:vWA domain-containing protein [Polyangium aurulentum]|uniref:vWA domain-containing protein n=1 Tax=Polyangium aurulentum TaxID=2567896 RepID=UPI0010ADF0D2|nr:VWA domain-containing protein [Polyangium aurulentum]UQA54825.1 VWA domain-containing protein [Polyangium aurulentum]